MPNRAENGRIDMEMSKVYNTIRMALQEGTEALMQETKLYAVSGFPIEQLIQLFASGYILASPSYSIEKNKKGYVKKQVIKKIIDKYENEIDKSGTLTTLNSFDLLRVVINDLEDILEE